MKVLIVVEPGLYGVFRHVEQLCHYLFSQRVDVHLAYSSLRGSDGLRALVEAVRNRGGQTLDMRTGNAPCLADMRAVVKLRSLARKVRPDVIHAHSSKAGVLGRVLAFTGIKGRFFYTAHAYYGLSGSRSLKTSFFNCIERLFGKIGNTINLSDDESVFAVRKLRIPSSRIHVIHNPINTAEFRPPTGNERNDIRTRFAIPNDALVIGSVGRLSFQKDPGTMYKAAAEVMNRHSNLWLCHVGSGELEAEISALAEKLGIASMVVRIPYLEAPAEIYRALDAFVFSSRYEGGPLVVLEAMASNLPLLLTACPGVSNISQGGLSHCWTAEPGDATGLAQAITSWVLDRENPRPINHRQIAEERFSTDVLFRAVLQLYVNGVNPRFACEIQ
jgi:glycosyltransferase involved in cell wall biosynthesis